MPVAKTSMTVAALAGFIGANALCAALCPGWLLAEFDPANKSEPGKLHQAYLKATDTPLIFLGSSLIGAALCGAPSNFLDDAASVDERKGKLGFFSWSTGGQHPSDAYYIARTNFVGNRKPRIAIYGIAPRDLMNNSLPTPASTPTLKYLSRLCNPWAMPNESFSDLNEHTQFVCKRSLFLADRKEAVTAFCTDEAKSAMNRWLPANITNRPRQSRDTPAAGGATRSASFKPAAPLDEPLTHESMRAPEWFQKGQRAVYTMVYRPFNRRKYAMQVSFLERVIAFCRQEHIELILVKMPLLKDDIDLMPEGMLARYSADIDSLSKKYGISVIDYDRMRIFASDDFFDLVHFNQRGAKKFQHELVKSLAAAPFKEKVIASTHDGMM